MSPMIGITVLLIVSFLGASSARAQDPSLRFGGQIPPEVDAIYEHGLDSGWQRIRQRMEVGLDRTTGCGVTGICL